MTQHVLVVGAGGAVGEAVAHALATRGWAVTASMRRDYKGIGARLKARGVACVQCDVTTNMEWPALAAAQDTIVFAAHLDITLAALKRLARPPTRVVAFSSNNVAADPNAGTYRALASAEQALRALTPHHAVIRPTLIYGDPRLPTIARLMRWARGPLMPLPGSGRARVQPVFHEDLAKLATGLATPGAPSGTFAAGGPDIITMRAFYQAVRVAAGGSALIAPIPAPLLKFAAPFAGGVFSREQAARADHDRIAIAQDPIPSELTPRTSLANGLTHLRQLMDAATLADD